jgi:spore maturation protein CgeB
MKESLDIVFLGLSITSSWGNGHATTYRGLIRALTLRGHRVLFLERDVPWYASNRDLPKPPFGRTELYANIGDLKERFRKQILGADLVIVGSYVPEGALIGNWVTEIRSGGTAFYDIDTPVTLARLKRGDCAYLTPDLIPRYQLYLSFTGGPILNRLEQNYGSPAARPLFCSVDVDHYFPVDVKKEFDLGYIGTYSDDRQPALENLLIDTARAWPQGKFSVAGPLYPETIAWPWNVKRFDHLPPSVHRLFYSSQRFTLNITRQDMIASGYSPSVRLFEAAACGTPIISDYWDGLDKLFVTGREIFLSRSTRETLDLLRDLPEHERLAAGKRARERILSSHTALHRAKELENHVKEVFGTVLAHD